MNAWVTIALQVPPHQLEPAGHYREGSQKLDLLLQEER